MKKHLLTFAIFAGGITTLFSQTIPNGSFENWTSTNYDYIQFYPTECANHRSMLEIGQAVLTKTNDPYHGLYAARMETKVLGCDTMPGYFINGKPNVSPPTGGIPISQSPTGLTGKYKCSIMPGDSGMVLAIFKKSGLAIPGGMYIKKFGGSQSSYASFKLTFSLSVVPDTVVIGAVSSDFTAGNGKPGSMLQIDSLNFTGVIAQPLNMNGSFELWNTGTFDKPNGWDVKGDSAAKSTSFYTGAYALLLNMVDYGNYWEPDQVTTGKWSVCSGGMTYGGYPYTLQNDSLVGYYKLITSTNDTASINLWGTKNFTMSVGGYGKYLTQSSVYKRFSMPINFSSMPDTLRIDIQAAKWPAQKIWVGSKLYVDALELKSQPLSVPTIFAGAEYFGVYPNPSNGIFNLVYDSEINEPVSLQVFNETGQLILSQQLQNKGAKNKIDISTFGRGLYILKTEQQGVISTKRVLVQ